MDTERPAEDRRGEHNEIGYRNTDEQRPHDERGTQGESGEDVAEADDDQQP